MGLAPCLRTEDEQQNTLAYGVSIARMTPSNRKDLKRHSAAVHLIYINSSSRHVADDVVAANLTFGAVT